MSTTTFDNTIEQLDPRSLLVDRNIRTDAALPKEFIGSIRQHGVLQPIVALRTDDGVRVRMGHRRTLAAVEAGLDTVPVVVLSSTDDEGEAAEIDRLITQHAENHHRAGLSTADNVAVAHQLSLLGLSANQIARRTNVARSAVDAAVKAGASELAVQATARYDLTLDQAASIAEFENDPDTVKALVVAARDGQFEHVVDRARLARAEAAAQAPVIERLTAEGLTVIDPPQPFDRTTDVDSLYDRDENPLDADAHRSCPGHAVYLSEVETYTEPDGTVLGVKPWGKVVWPEGAEPADEDEATRRFEQAEVTVEWLPSPVCTDPGAHGHMTRGDLWRRRDGQGIPAAEKSEAEREADRQARRLVIDNNKAWKSARTVRQAWVKTFLGRKTAPAATGTFLAVALTRDSDLIADYAANAIAAQWFGAEAASYGRSGALSSLATETSDKRGLVLALGAALAGYEHDAADSAWRRDGESSPTGRYLRFLASVGYPLSDVEAYAISDQTV